MKQSESYLNGSSVTGNDIPLNHTQTESVTPDDVTAAIPAAKCYFCGLNRHPRTKCPAREVICKGCGKKGHFQRVCLSSSNASGNRSATNSVLSAMFCSAAPQSLSDAIITVSVNDVKLQALVDTGSSESYISSSVVRNNSWELHPGTSKITLANTQCTSQTEGQCYLAVRYKESLYPRFRFSVMPNLCADILFGHDFLKLHEEVEIPFGGPKPSLSICGLMAAKVSPPSLFGNLSADCKPVATKSRRHSIVDERFIKCEVENLLKEGIIEPSLSPWRAQVLVTTNERHKRRLVIDYSQTINRFTYLDAYPLPRIDQLVENVSAHTIFSTLDLRSAYHQIPLRKEDKPFTAFEAAGKLYQFCRIPFGVTNGVACFQRIIDEIISKEKLSGTFAYVDNVVICGHNKADHDKNLSNFLETAKRYGLTFNDTKSILAVSSIKILGYEVSKGVIKPDPDRLAPLNALPPPVDLKSQQRAVGMFAYYSHWIPRYSDTIYPLVHNQTFPLPEAALTSFKQLKSCLENALLITIDPSVPLTVETDASDIAIAATLNQRGRPVAFFSRTLNPSEQHHSAVEKEACAIVEAVRKWRHYLINHCFQLVTDQRSVSFMYDNKQRGKIKNDKIQRWRLELSQYRYDVIYRPGRLNQAADALSRAVCGFIEPLSKLRQLHENLCHPGVTRFIHFIRARNLPYSLEEVRKVTSDCVACCAIKPQFHKPMNAHLIKATQPFERLSLDFKGPLPSTSRNRYLLTIIDEYSRFPFAFPCPDMTTQTVINCLRQIFTTFGTPGFVHTDRGSSFMSSELRHFLNNNGIATSRTTPYNPQCNGQVERLNGTLWKSISLTLKSRGLQTSQWESVLLDALHSIRSLLCTATNATPHERLFAYNRRSATGTTLPSWLSSPGTVLLKKHSRDSKYDPCVEEVELLECNPQYAHVRLPDGREDTVSIRHLAPRGEGHLHLTRPSDFEENSDRTEQHPEMHDGDDPQVSNSPMSHPVQCESAEAKLEEHIQKQQRVHSYNLRTRQA